LHEIQYSHARQNVKHFFPIIFSRTGHPWKSTTYTGPGAKIREPRRAHTLAKGHDQPLLEYARAYPAGMKQIHPVQARRRKALLRQRDIAAAIGVSVSAVKMWESGRRIAGPRLVQLAVALGTTVPVLLREIRKWERKS